MPFAPPPEPLSDGVVRLRPLGYGDVDGFEALVADPDVLRFTRVPDPPPFGFARSWLSRYVDGWATGEVAGFAIELEGEDLVFAGFAGIVRADAEAAEGELGYIVAPALRGRGIAQRALVLLTAWALGPAGLERAELVIDLENAGSLAVAERAGFHQEGVRRGSWVKVGTPRRDVTIWSRLRSDRPPAA